jgi:hypothetical protein
MRALKDRYGFLFWLRWIVSFAGSFILSGVLWTSLLAWIFGPIRGEELLMTWAVAVFGTWFILVIPFMRKKEQIWKRLNDDQERAVDAWLTGLGFFIGLFVLSAFLWDLSMKERLLDNAPGLDPLWMKAVFGTWLAILIPLLVWMYRSADRLFRTANERQTYSPGFQAQWIEPKKRMLPESVSAKLRGYKPTLPGGHLVALTMKDGSQLSNVFVLLNGEVAGIYDYSLKVFDASQVTDIRSLSSEALPAYDESKWVRFNVLS